MYFCDKGPSTVRYLRLRFPDPGHLKKLIAFPRSMNAVPTTTDQRLGLLAESTTDLTMNGGTMEVARWLVAFVALVTALGGLMVDYLLPSSAAQHMKNPKWPPHAKFHNAQGILIGLFLCV